MNVTNVAEPGTIIHCRACNTPIAKLTRPIKWGGILATDSVEILTGQEVASGDVVLCPTNPAHIGAYALVGGNRWYTF